MSEACRAGEHPHIHVRAGGKNRGWLLVVGPMIDETVMPRAMVLAIVGGPAPAKRCTQERACARFPRLGRADPRQGGWQPGHVRNAVITKSNARITIDENTTVRVVEYATPSLVGGAV